MRPLISIIIPVYNVEPYVERAILSVLSQTYQNIEIIIVDDCGQDNSMRIVQDVLSRKNKHAFIYRHNKNRGLSAARNTGMNHANGDYVFFLDSDDSLPPSAIEDLVLVLNKFPDSDMIVGNMAKISNAGEVIKSSKDFSHFLPYSNDRRWIVRNIFDYSKGYFIPSSSPNKLYSKEFLIKNNLLFVEGLLHEDEKMILDIAECLSSIAFCSKVTYNRYVNPNSIMTTLDPNKSAFAWCKIIHDSYPNFLTPYIDLKILYCLCELKRLSFIVTQRASFKAIKEVTSGLLKYSYNMGYLWLYLLSLCLFLLPFKVRQLHLVSRIYNRLFYFPYRVKNCSLNI